MNEHHMTGIFAIYDFLAICGMLLLVVVAAQADNDRQLKRWESPGLRQARRASFLVAEVFLLWTVLVQGWLWEPSLIAAGNLVPGMLILAVNAVSLNSRAPPDQQQGTVAAIPRVLARVVHRVKVLRRGMLR